MTKIYDYITEDLFAENAVVFVSHMYYSGRNYLNNNLL